MSALSDAIRAIGHTVNVCLQPMQSEPTGELWTVSTTAEHYRLGQGSTLEEAIAALPSPSPSKDT